MEDEHQFLGVEYIVNNPVVANSDAVGCVCAFNFSDPVGARVIS